MARLIAGFVVGVLATIGALTLLGKLPGGTQVTGNGSAAPSADTSLSVSADGNDTVQQAIDSGDELSTARADAARTTGIDEAMVPSDSISGSEAVATPPGEKDPASMPELQPTAASLDNRRNFPPEIARMLEERVDKELHARYEADDREDSWATYMEGQLGAYFGGKPALAPFGFSLIDCRTTFCEVHVLGYGPDALTVWNTSTADLVSQSWHDFNSMSMDRFNPQPDVLGIVLILSRKPG